jgi:threonine dehydrogenase-like Zn-dependent dehydrogenase
MDRRSLYFTGPGKTAIRDTDVTPDEDEVLVETDVSGISAGTELLIYRDEAPTGLEADATIDALQGDLSYPVRYGYAAVGTVIDTGRAVDQDWRGRGVFGFNPHETRFAARPETVLPVPEDVTREAMALYPTVETATSLVLDGRPRIGERVVVFGAGIVGLCTIGLLSSFPLDRLDVVEPIEQRRDHALRLGADRAVSPNDYERELALADEEPAGADLVYELSGNPTALDDALTLAGYDSRLIVGSWYGNKRANLDLGADFHRDRVSIESSQVSTLAPDTRGRFTRDRRTALALDHLQRMEPTSLVTHRIPFSEAPSAYRMLDRRQESTIQVLLTYE